MTVIFVVAVSFGNLHIPQCTSQQVPGCHALLPDISRETVSVPALALLDDC